MSGDRTRPMRLRCPVCKHEWTEPNVSEVQRLIHGKYLVQCPKCREKREGKK